MCVCVCVSYYDTYGEGLGQVRSRIDTGFLAGGGGGQYIMLECQTCISVLAILHILW